MNEIEIERRMTETEARSKSNTKWLDDVEARQDNLDKLVSSVAVMAKEQEHIKADVQGIKADVKTLTDQPAKRWNFVIEKIIIAIVGAVVGYFLVKLGMGA